MLHTNRTRVRGFVVGGLALGALVTGAAAANAAVANPDGGHEPMHAASSAPDTREGVVAPAGTRIGGFGVTPAGTRIGGF